AARPADRLWRSEVSYARARRAETNVGVPGCAGLGARAPDPAGVGAARKQLGCASTAPRNQPSAERGDPALPQRGLSRGGGFQRRALRPPLVRETSCVSPCHIDRVDFVM